MDMGNAVGTGSRIKGIGIGQKGPGLEFPDGLNDSPDKDGADIGRIALFPEMEFYCGQLVFL